MPQRQINGFHVFSEAANGNSIYACFCNSTHPAEIDAALLADDLPPKAYSDAGFAEFLKTPPE